MTYAKLLSETQVRIAPRKYQRQGLISFHFNENVELMKQEGFYPIVETNKPEDIQDETHYARPTYRLVEDIQTVTNQEEDEEGYMVDVNERIDNSYIECIYVAEEIVEEQE